MLDADRSEWESVWAGERAPTWADMFGHVSQSDTLTALGAEVCSRAATFLDGYFTPAWLPRALGYDGNPDASVPTLRRFCPVSPHWPQGVVSDLLTWATTLKAVVEAATPGSGQMRRDTRGDISENRLIHTLAMARLATMGLAAHIDVDLETQRDDVFADVVWRNGATQAAIEVVAMTSGEQWTQATNVSDAASARLDRLTLSYGVHFHGDVPPEAVSAEDQAWWLQLERLARSVGRTGRARTARTDQPTGVALHVSPGSAPVGSTLTFPLIEVNQVRRLLNKLRAKAKQTARGGPAVLWVEDMGMLGPLTPFDALPLEVQVRELGDFIQPVLAVNRHIAAVVLSSGSRRTTRPMEQSVRRRSGHGLVRAIGKDRQRRTLVIPGPAAESEATTLLVDLAGREQELIDTSVLTTWDAPGFESLFAPGPAGR